MILYTIPVQLLMIQAKTLSKAILVFGLRSLMDKAFLTYTLYGWPCWGASGGGVTEVLARQTSSKLVFTTITRQLRLRG